MTNPAWAAVFMLLACILAITALFSHSSNADKVITIASSIVTGAFGYIQGYTAGKNSIQIPQNPDSPSSAVTVIPQSSPNVPK